MAFNKMPEPIDVISMFHKKTIRPVKFKYSGRVHKVTRILYTWVTREGGFPVHHFSVLTDDDNRFELSLNTYTLRWTIDDAEAAA